MRPEEQVIERCIDGAPHIFVFLRNENQESFTRRADVFFCEKCLKYFEKIIWEGGR